MNKFIKSDPMLCIGCRTCMVACVVNHTEKNVFAMDPDSYDFTPRCNKTGSVPSMPETQMHGSMPFQRDLYG